MRLRNAINIGLTLGLFTFQIPLVHMDIQALNLYRLYLPNICTESHYYTGLRLGDYLTTSIGDTIYQVLSYKSIDGHESNQGLMSGLPAMARLVLITGDKQRYLIPQVNAYLKILLEAGEDASSFYLLFNDDTPTINPDLMNVMKSSYPIRISFVIPDSDQIVIKSMPHPSYVLLLISKDGRIEAQSQFMTPCALRDIIQY